MRAHRIQLSSKDELLKLVTDKPHVGNLQSRLGPSASVVVLFPKLSALLVGKLAAIGANRGPMRAVIASLYVPKHYRRMGAMQEDALQTILRAFGLSGIDQAISLELVKGQAITVRPQNVRPLVG